MLVSARGRWWRALGRVLLLVLISMGEGRRAKGDDSWFRFAAILRFLWDCKRHWPDRRVWGNQGVMSAPLRRSSRSGKGPGPHGLPFAKDAHVGTGGEGRMSSMRVATQVLRWPL
jgi:hypothetical protein